MNLYLLVEDRRGGKKVYRAWLQHRFPGLRSVDRIEDMEDNCFFIISGNGYPACLNRIDASLADIHDHHRPVTAFVVCVDSEEESWSERHSQVHGVLETSLQRNKLHESQPQLCAHVVVHTCCMETWFLGHDKMLRRNPTSARLVTWKKFYDVSQRDPEEMPAPPGYLTKASFHLEYLQEMLREQQKSYTKQNPGVIVEANYLQALQERGERTGHLSSLIKMLEIWRRLSGWPEELS